MSHSRLYSRERPASAPVFARAWQNHGPSSVGYNNADGRFVQIAECSGFGNTNEDAEQTARQIVDALNAHDTLAEELGDLIGAAASLASSVRGGVVHREEAASRCRALDAALRKAEVAFHRAKGHGGSDT